MSAEFNPSEIIKILDAKRKVKDKLKSFFDDFSTDLLLSQYIFLSGGCFASLLQGETPKDYDVYFKLEDVATRLCHLYTLPQLKEKVAVIEEKYRDVEGHPSGLCITENAMTLKSGIQLIKKHYGSPEEIRKTFDFVHCMPYYDPFIDKLYISRQQYDCCVKKYLVVNSIGNYTPLRESKFKMRGYIYDDKYETQLS